MFQGSVKYSASILGHTASKKTVINNSCSLSHIISYIYGFIYGSKFGTRPVVKKLKVSFPHYRINPISMNGHNLQKRKTLEFPFLMLQSRCFYALATFLLRWKQCFPQEGKTSRKPRDMCDLPAKYGGFFAEFSSYKYEPMHATIWGCLSHFH